MANPVIRTGNVSTVDPGERLRGNMGVGELVMSVLAFSSPLTTVAGFIPVLLVFSGATAPGIYLGLTFMLLMFSVGFVKMSQTVKNPGGFYSFITVGLGKRAGLGAALLALFGYVILGFFAPSLFAVTLQPFVTDTLNGPEIAWYWYALAIIIVTTTLAYNKIDLSAKVLTTVMALEILVVIIFNIASFSSGVSTHESIGFSLPALGDAGLGLALLFAVGNFFGFEATVIYRDEVKDPDRTIPRATYLAVAGIGLFYALAAWAYIALLGPDNVQEEATNNTVSLFNDGLINLVGKTFSDIAIVLLITSILASMLSIQNIAARYAFTLAKDGALPSFLGRVHPKQKSPYLSALSIGIVWFIALIVLILAGTPAESIYAVAAGSGGYALVLLITIASLAVFVYFLRHRNVASSWKTTLAPLASFLMLMSILLLSTLNYPELIGGSITITVVFLLLTISMFVAGIVYASYLKKANPTTFVKLGRQTPETTEI